MILKCMISLLPQTNMVKKHQEKLLCSLDKLDLVTL